MSTDFPDVPPELPAPSGPSPGGVSLGHIWLIATYGIRFALRTGGGVVFLIMLLLVGLGVAAAFIAPAEALTTKNPYAPDTGMTPAEMTRELLESEQVVSVVKGITGTEEAQANYLLKEKPGLLSAMLIVLLFLMPFTVCLGTSNQTAGDVGTRGLRFLLLRTERPNIFFGRFLAAALYGLGCTALYMALVVVYIQFKLKVYGGGELWGWGLQGYVAIAFLVLPYIAMCAWISGVLDSAFASVSLCLLAAVFPPLFFWFTKATVKNSFDVELDWLSRLVPWGWRYDLLSVNAGERLLSMGVMLGFTMVFLALGYHFFRKRDL